MRALRIMDVERHPSLMGIGTCKEGFSFLSMLDRCVTVKVCRSTKPKQALKTSDPMGGHVPGQETVARLDGGAHS